MANDYGQLVKILPEKTGVYLFKDKHDQVFYIGKALNIKKRIADHWRSKSERFLELTEKIDYLTTESEVESLLLEARLIKQYRPKYNIRLKDSTRYLYVGLTKDKYPLIRLIRQPENEPHIKEWFGPFPSAQSLREILRLLRQVFPYCTGSSKKGKACFYYHLQLCPGVCFKPVSDYPKTIEKIRLFLNGQISILTRNLKAEMQQAAKNLEFEKAGVS